MQSAEIAIRKVKLADSLRQWLGEFASESHETILEAKVANAAPMTAPEATKARDALADAATKDAHGVLFTEVLQRAVKKHSADIIETAALLLMDDVRGLAPSARSEIDDAMAAIRKAEAGH